MPIARHRRVWFLLWSVLFSREDGNKLIGKVVGRCDLVPWLGYEDEEGRGMSCVESY